MELFTPNFLSVRMYDDIDSKIRAKLSLFAVDTAEKYDTISKQEKFLDHFTKVTSVNDSVEERNERQRASKIHS